MSDEEYMRDLHKTLDEVLTFMIVSNGINDDYNCLIKAVALLIKGHRRGYPLSMTIENILSKEDTNDEA